MKKSSDVARGAYRRPAGEGATGAADPGTAEARKAQPDQPVSAAVGAQPGPRRGLPPATDRDLYDRAHWLWTETWWSNEKHDVLAGRWSVLDTWIRLILAIVASVSAISLLQDQPQLALAFALTTALLSAVNAALDPASRSKEHRAASHSLRHVELNAGQLVGIVQSRNNDTRMEGAPGHERFVSGLTVAELEDYGQRLIELERESEELFDKAPPLNRLRSGQYRYPRTEWGFARLQRRLEMRRRVDALYNAPPPDATPPDALPDGTPPDALPDAPSSY